MKVCFITFEYPPQNGGMGVACKRIAQMLSKNGFSVSVVTTHTVLNNPFFNKKEIVERGVEGDVNVFRRGPSSGRVFDVPASEVYDVISFVSKLHEKEDFDVFHGFGLHPSGYVAAYLGKKFGKKSIASIRGVDGSIDLFDSRFFPIIRWTLENASVVSSVAKSILDECNVLVPLKEKGKVIYNSFNPSQFFLKNDLSIKEDIFTFGFSGQIRSKKGFVYILDAFRKFSKNIKSRLVIIGDIRPEEVESYKESLKGLNVFFTSRVPHSLILNYIKDIDVFLYPSLSEGCPNALLEAMACKVVPIVTPVGAMGEILEDGVNGFIVPTRNSEALFKKMRFLYENPKKRNEMGINAKNLILEKYTPNIELNKWTEVYEA